MALPQALLDQFPSRLVWRAEAPVEQAQALDKKAFSTLEALDAVLPDGGLLRGGVVELASQGGASLGSSVALAACRSAQQEGYLRAGEPSWCAFVDPGGTLYGPGVEQAQVALERLLVVCPPLSALSRVAVRMASSRVFSLLVLDLAAVPGAELNVPLGPWARWVRQLALLVEGSMSSVVLLTDARSHRPLPLPVAQRIELSRVDPRRLKVSVKKDRSGRMFSPQIIELLPEQNKLAQPLRKASAFISGNVSTNTNININININAK